MSAHVPLADPGAENSLLSEPLGAALRRVLDSGSYVLGAEVSSFEREFARFSQAQHAVGVASGTDALTLALAACGVGPEDEVITVSHTAGATVAAILRAGAVPVLVDVDPATLTMAADQLEPALSERTRALLPVHLYGGAADLSALREFAEAHHLALIEDCAQAHGTTYEGEPVGARADAAAFSFYPTKNLAALGDGGAVVTSRPEVAERLRALRQYGWRSPQVSEELGWNSRLDELQAAVLRVKLAAFAELLGRRREVAAAYAATAGSELVLHPSALPAAEHSFHLYVVRSSERDRLARHLGDAGIGTGIHYPVPVHRQPAYSSLAITAPLQATERAAGEILSLPIYPGITPEAVDRVVAALSSFRA